MSDATSTQSVPLRALGSVGTLDGMSEGQLALIEHEGAPALVIPFLNGEARCRLILAAEPFEYRGQQTHTLVLLEEHLSRWPNVLILDEAEIVPDPASMLHTYRYSPLTICLTMEGRFLCSLDPQMGLRTFFLSLDRSRVESPRSTDYWMFTRWSVRVPDPSAPNATLPVFSLAGEPPA